MDERHAVARLKRGDIGGLEALVQRYQVEAVRTAYLITRDPAKAEDIVQAAFLQAYWRIHQFDSERPFAPWFMRSVINGALKAVTRNRHISLEASNGASSEPLGEGLSDPAPTPAESAELQETRQAVWEAMDKLSPEQRAVIVLRYFLNYSEQEMAEALRCPPGTVKWRLHAAKERLRTLLGSHWNAGELHEEKTNG